MIRKYAQQKDNSQLDSQLEAYSKQAKAYKSQQKAQFTKNFKKGTLIALIPLAAVGAANAQCQGAANGGATITLSGNGASFLLDVDDDGNNDLSFNVYTQNTGNSVKLRLNILDFAWSVLRDGTAIIGVGKKASMYNVTNANGGFSQGNSATTIRGRDHGMATTYGNWGGPLPVSGFIGVKKGAAPGWIQLEISEAFNIGAGSLVTKFKILERGIEDNGDNSAITGNCPSLPVEMTYFRTELKGEAVDLQWGTAVEINNAGFEVQRSTDGRFFHKIGWVEGNGTTTEGSEYSFMDENIKPNVNYYYRLKQVDHDGAQEFSTVESVMYKNEEMVAVGDFFPNPLTSVAQGAQIDINVPTEGTVLIQVFDARGAIIQTLDANVVVGQNRLTVSLDNASAGQYYAKIQIGDKVEYRKLIVK